ncbi:MAG TPA: DEAD/DEAH box helicase [Clostridia bacterium]|nr:DEAD/DEAH box helicase [Clostridia bacterium]
MNSNFNDLGISPPILKAIEEMGFKMPTKVQSKAIPHVLKREDLIVMSKTGSGKTAVFGIPLLQMTDPAAAGPQALILTPTRELAVQIDSDLKQMSKHLRHRTTAVYGQHNMNVEMQALSKGTSIVTGTPGRVYDHISRGSLVTKHVNFLVLDEADRMLDMGFIDQVERIINTIPGDRMTLLFSATIPSEIKKICRDYMKHPVTIEIESQTKTVDTTRQIYYRVEHNEKNTQLNRLLMVEQPESCMIFCNTRVAVDRVQSFLSRKGYATQALHGDIPQGRRLKTMQQFKQGKFHLLVATDVAARGIHIEGLSLVVNYDVPVEKDSYVHRIGRTGRAGKTGRAVTLVTGDDIMNLYAIEEHIGARIEEEELPSESVLNERRASAEKWIQSKSPQRLEKPSADVQHKAPAAKAVGEFDKKPQKSNLPRSVPEAGNKKRQKRPQYSRPYQRHDEQRNRQTGIEAAQQNHTPIQSPEPLKNFEPAAKKSFLKRMLQRILGK